MATKINAVHIGNAIERRIKEIGISKKDFAEKIGIPHTNVVRILRSNSIDTIKLSAICIALDYNFFEDFCPNIKHQSSSLEVEEGIVKIPASTFEKLEKERINQIDKLIKEKEDLKDYIKQLENQLSDLQNGLTLREIAQKKKNNIL